MRLPVGGGAGVEDVLLSREQRQAVGIKVDRLRAHDGNSFQTTPAASLLTFPDGFRGRECSAAQQPQRSTEGRSTQQQQSNADSCDVDFKSQSCSDLCRRCALTAWKRLRLHTALCAAGENRFSPESPTSR